MQVEAGSIEPAATAFTGSGLSGGIVGQPLEFLITPRDAFGNVCNTGTVSLGASASLQPEDGLSMAVSLPISVVSLQNGSFAIIYSSTEVKPRLPSRNIYPIV